MPGGLSISAWHRVLGAAPLAVGDGLTPWRWRRRRGMGSRFGRRRIGLKLRSAPFAVGPNRQIVRYIPHRVLPRRYSAVLRGYDRAAIATRLNASHMLRGPEVMNSPHRL